jgi:hypothetical protein
MACLISLVPAIIADPRPVAESLVVTAVSIAISVVIGLTLVDYLTRRQRTIQWHRVNAQTVRAIHATSMEIAFSYYLALTPTVKREDDKFLSYRDDRDVPTSATVQMLEWLGSQLAQNKTELARADEARIVVIPRGEDLNAMSSSKAEGAIFVQTEEAARKVHKRFMDDAASRSLYRDVRDYLHELRDVLTPRVLQMSDDAQLVSALTKVEAREREWRQSIELIEEWGAPEDQGWEAAASLLDALARVESHLATNPW